MSKKRIIRKDLRSITEFSKETGMSRTTIYDMINRGDLHVEEISGKDYIKIESWKNCIK